MSRNKKKEFTNKGVCFGWNEKYSKYYNSLNKPAKCVNIYACVYFSNVVVTERDNNVYCIHSGIDCCVGMYDTTPEIKLLVQLIYLHYESRLTPTYNY